MNVKQRIMACRLIVLVALVASAAATTTVASDTVDEKTGFEAAFQGDSLLIKMLFYLFYNR